MEVKIQSFFYYNECMLHLIEMFIFLNLFDCSFSSIGNSANLHIKLYRTEKPHREFVTLK